MKKFQIKLYLEPNDAFDPEALIPVFHGWIREKKLDELVIDVADYGHVKEGPGVVLIGHGSDYYLDEGEGRRGLLYSRKRALDADDEAAFVDALKRTLRAARFLEEDTTLPSLRFSLAEIVVRVNDRLVAPNDDATFEALSPIVARALEKALGKAPKLDRIGGERELFTIRATGGDIGVTEALSRLG